MVPQARGFVLIILLAGALLSGCTSGNGGKKGVDPAAGADFTDLGLQATASTGIIRGVIVDEAIRPLANATVGLQLADGAPRNATSAPDGAFGFDGLPPGTYFLHVAKPGYRSVQASTDVRAGVDDPPIVKVLLVADPNTIPYVSTYQFDAFIACSFTLVTVSFAACGLAADQTNNAFLVNYRPDKPPAWIQVESVWQSTQTLGNELGLSITALGPPQVTVNATDGPSPIYITVNQTDAQRFNFTGPDAADVTIRLFSTELMGTDVIPEEQVHAVWKSTLYGPVNGTGAPALYQSTVVDNDPTGVLVNPFSDPNCVDYPVLFDDCWRFGGTGMALQQKVAVYTHIFYGYAPAPGWRFSSGDPVPSPPA